MTSAAVAMPRGTGSTPAPQTRVPVRLTRRGRFVAFLGAVLLAASAGLLFRPAASEAGADRRPPVEYEYVVVEPGQTLWQIAEQLAPDVDPRVTIMRIQDINGLPSAGVLAGQRIAVPRSS
jgi:hypothetical protein